MQKNSGIHLGFESQLDPGFFFVDLFLTLDLPISLNLILLQHLTVQVSKKKKKKFSPPSIKNYFTKT